MIQPIALIIVVIAGLYFIALATASLLIPDQAKRYLLGFAGSPLKHFTELILRFAVGGALILYSPHMLFSKAFAISGWILLATTACLFLIPWRWHRRFAEFAVPQATQYITLIGLSSLLLGVLVLTAVIQGGTG